MQHKGGPNKSGKERKPVLPVLEAAPQGKNEVPNVDLEFERTDLTRTSSLEDLKDYHAKEYKKYKQLEDQSAGASRSKGGGGHTAAVQAPWKYFLGVKLHKKNNSSKFHNSSKKHTPSGGVKRRNSDGEISDDPKNHVRSRTHTASAAVQPINIPPNGDSAKESDSVGGNGALSKSMEERPVVGIKSNFNAILRRDSPMGERITTSLLHIQPTGIKPLVSAGSLMELKCCRDESIESFADIAAATSVNLYPMLPDTQQKLADPICDYFRCQLFQNRVIAAIADGCGWGFASATAALLAVNSFVCFINHNQQFITDLRSAGDTLLDALTCAHERILYGFSNAQMFQVGTTTLCGGILMQVDDSEEDDSSSEDEIEEEEIKPKHKSPSSPRARGEKLVEQLTSSNDKGKEKLKDKEKEKEKEKKEKEKEKEKEKAKGKQRKKKHGGKSQKPIVSDSDSDADISCGDETDEEKVDGKEWVFICTSIGDCKALHYSAKDHKLFNVTAKGRSKATDQRDPGGRLGPSNGQYADRRPDLRNLGVYSVRCREGDIIILLSDGIYDNFDPQLRGLLPKELGLDVDKWADAENATVEVVKERFMLDHMLSVIRPDDEAPLTPYDVVSRLTDSCTSLLEKSINFMENNPNEALPQDYVLYPGKMDHATSLAFLVGNNDFCSFRRRRNI